MPRGQFAGCIESEGLSFAHVALWGRRVCVCCTHLLDVIHHGFLLHRPNQHHDMILLVPTDVD
eukprot:scaffold8671_cov17-Tisochrysis_lutea.AAC.1